MRNYLLWLSLAALTTLAACNAFDDLDGIETTDYEAEYAIPLIDTDLSMGDILENFEESASLTIDPDGLIRFKYSGDVLTKTSEEIFEEINRVLGLVPIQITSKRQALPFTSPDGLDIDRMDLKAGNLVYALQNVHSEQVYVVLSFPNVVKDGQMLSFMATIPGYSGSGTPPQTGNLFTPFSLTGYTITPENDSVYVEYQALDGAGNEVTLGQSGLLITNLAFSYAEGYLGNQLYEGGRDTIIIDFFDEWVRGDVYFEEPKITFNFQNSFGLPTRSVVNLFNILTVRGEVLPLESEYITNGVDFPYPSLDEVGQVKSAEFLFTKENSNIDVVLGAGPTAVDYDINAFTNPDMDTGIRGFLTDSSFYKVRVDVELPLYGSAVDFAARDTFDLDFSKFDEVRAAEFKLLTDNGMPLSIDVQGYFLDDSGAVLDSLLSGPQRIIDAAPVDNLGHVTEINQQITYAPFDAARFDRIRNAARLAIVANFSTFNDGNVSVRVLNSQQVRFRLGVKIKTGN